MAQGRLQATVKHFKTQLLHHESAAEQALEHAYRATLVHIQPQLDALLRAIAAKQQAGEQVPLSWLYEQNRLKHLKAMLQSQIDHFAAYSQQVTEQAQHQGVALGLQSGHAQLQATVPDGISYTFGVPKPEAIRDLVGATQKGSPLAELFDGFGKEAADNVGKALIIGLTNGDNPREVARDVEQALQVPRQRALTIARTEMLRSYRSANLESYRANSDVCEKWEWVCDKSARTCAACLAMDGTLHDLDEEMASHVNCRCSAAPQTKSWSDILSPLGIDASDLDESDQGDRQTGAEWFDEQDEATQRQILGNAKYDAYKNGDFELSDIVGYSHSEDWGSSIREKSLKELVKGR